MPHKIESTSLYHFLLILTKSLRNYDDGNPRHTDITASMSQSSGYSQKINDAVQNSFVGRYFEME
jgi:hypothetical protein